MAKEIKSINVDPSEEENTINVWQTFGWEFKSTQEVKTSDSSHLEQRGDSIYSVTKAGDHYVKLTFERDPAKQNYAELASLQKQYDSVPEPGRRSSLFSKFSFIIMAIGAVIAFFGFIMIGNGDIGPALIFVLPGLGIIFLRVFFHIRKNKQWDKDYDNMVNKRTMILALAKPVS
jgi:hypothetical protein